MDECEYIIYVQFSSELTNVIDYTDKIKEYSVDNSIEIISDELTNTFEIYNYKMCVRKYDYDADIDVILNFIQEIDPKGTITILSVPSKYLSS